MAYATVQDLHDLLGFTASDAQVLLDRASMDVDRAIQSAVYPVDTDGQPTESTVAQALKKATLQQVAYQLEVGNKTGIPHGLQSGVPSGAPAGEISLSRGPSTGGASSDQPWLAPHAAWVLRSAGLLGQAPQTYTWPRYP